MCTYARGPDGSPDEAARSPLAARHNACRMDPSRKRRVRLVVALTAAVLLAGALVWTSFGSAAQTRTPSQLLASASAGQSYQLTGKVVPGYTRKRDGAPTSGCVTGRERVDSGPLHGELPDPFRGGREVIVNVRKQGDVFVGEKDTLVTKCPSKFSAAKPKSRVLTCRGRQGVPDPRVRHVPLRRRRLDLRRPHPRRDWVASGRRAVYALSGTVFVAFVILEVGVPALGLLLRPSSTRTRRRRRPTFYRMAAPWSSQEGSLLLWLLL